MLGHRIKRTIIYVLLALFWMAAACILLRIILTKENEKGMETSVQQIKSKENQKIAYLTFDDGPSVLTEKYLNILEEKKAVATFFLIGQQLEDDLVPVVKKAIKNGNEIGIHTYLHEANKIYSSKEAYYQDLQKTKQCIQEKLQYVPKCFRFPWGSANSYVKSFKGELVQEMEKENIRYVDWNVSGEDCVGCPSVNSILEQFRKDYPKYQDPVILLHDAASCKATLLALPTIITELRQKGYTFDVISNRKAECHFGEY